MSADKKTTVPVQNQATPPQDAPRGPIDPIPGIIPYHGISILAGAPNVGKTALLAGMARDFRDGRPIFGHQPNKITGLGIICADRGWVRGAGIWFNRAGFPEIRQYALDDDPLFEPQTFIKKFERVRRFAEYVDRLELPPGALLLVDPLAPFLGGSLLDYDSCMVACHGIRKVLRTRDLSSVGTAHSGKLKADKKQRYMRMQDQILGSTAIFGFCDTQMYLASPDETGKPYYTFLWNSHELPPEFHFLERDEQGLFVPYSGADQGNCTRVLALFPEDGTPTTTGQLLELAEAIPLSRATLFRVLETLVERERIEKLKHGVYRRVTLQ